VRAEGRRGNEGEGREGRGGGVEAVSVGAGAMLCMT
jgi:hypothetical protein